ncbi:MAG: hypothetical protein VX351_03375, partial [Planctomycetota bacterium]|nr:hypothetical protein [Planctomycetota bacterium]
MRIAQYQLVTAVFIAALAPTPAVHAADGLTGVSSVRALADDRTLGASQEATISRFAEEAGRALSARNPSEDHLEAVRIDLMAPLSGGCTPAFARAYGARLLEAFGEYDNDSRTPQQQMIAFSVLSATGSSASLLDLAERIVDLDSETAAWKPMAMCQTLSQGVAKATTLDLAERNRSDLARIFGRIASRVSPSANRHVMEGFVMLGGGEREDIARRWADALKSLASREALAAEDLLCMEGATVKLRSVLLNPANRETRDAREAAARALAPALLAFHARAADHLDGDGPNTDRLRAHLGRVDQVLPFLDVRG